MPNREERRSGELEAVKIRIVCGGDPYEISLGDISALDEMDYYRATGQTFMDVFSGKVSSFAIAGILWVYRRRYEKGLTFDEVLKEFKLSDLESLKLGDDEDDDEPERAVVVAGNGQNPERSGGPSVPNFQGSPQSTG